MGFEDGYAADQAGKGAEFRRRLLEEKITWEQSHPIFVTDRTHVDNAVYSMLQGTWKTGSVGRKQYTEPNERYTHVFLCLMSTFWDLGKDPSRNPLRVYHEDFERLLLAGLPRMIETVPITIVTPRSLEERVAFVERVLGVHRCPCGRRMAPRYECIVCSARD
jgi:hypothetical protein